MVCEKVAALNWIHELYQHGQKGEAGETYGLLLVRIADELNADSGVLSLLEEGGGELVVAAQIGCETCKPGEKVDASHNLLHQVVGESREILANVDDGHKNPCSGKVVEKDGGLAMCWPLRMEDKVIGALCICRQNGKERYSEEDLRYGSVLVALVAVIIENLRMHTDQNERIGKLSEMNARFQEINKKLEQANNQLLQSEKMASIGQLAAGVAHEINNPIGYVYSNIGTLEKYLRDFFTVLDLYEKAEVSLEDNLRDEIRQAKQRLDLAFLKQDVLDLLGESREGINRVKKIVQDLKDFSHVGAEEEWQWADLHKGLDSTLNIVWNELKYKSEVVKEYGDLPRIYCLPSQLNQVFMNLLVNAAHAIDTQGTITLRTGSEGDRVWVEVEDTGHGIPPELLSRIFDPFFTTKPVGKGTGLGLSVSYSIVEKHGGKIDVKTELGRGTTFRVWLPVKPEGMEEAKR